MNFRTSAAIAIAALLSPALSSAAPLDNPMIAKLRATALCEEMPASTNSFGAGCAEEVARRLPQCTKSSGERFGALHDCLGFQRPPEVSGLGERVKALSLKKMAQHKCETDPPLLNPRGDRCGADVEERADWCVPLYLSHELTSEQYWRCLGFAVLAKLPPPRTVIACERANIVARVSVTQAREAAWPQSKPRTIDGKALFVAPTPIFDQRDIDSLRLEEQDYPIAAPPVELDGTSAPSLEPGIERAVVVELSEASSKRLTEATRDRIGEYVILSIAGHETAARIEGPIETKIVRLTAGDTKPSDLCREVAKDTKPAAKSRAPRKSK